MPDASKTLFNRNLAIRILSSLALIPVVLGAVYVGEWAFFALIALICGVGMHEWIDLTAPKTPLRGRIAIVAGVILILLVGSLKGPVQALGLSVLMAALVGFYAGQGDKAARKGRALWAAVGVPYLTVAGLAMLFLRDAPERGLGLTLYVLFVVWATDTGAYFAGRLIGGPKLLPSISPKKTWAGLIGGMVAAALLGYGVALKAAGLGEPSVMAAAGAVTALVAQAGDFFESAVKRRAGAKDSGTLIPGHGGVLDRVDGLLFAAPFVALLVWLGL